MIEDTPEAKEKKIERLEDKIGDIRAGMRGNGVERDGQWQKDV